jgi:hypothetical protein
MRSFGFETTISDFNYAPLVVVEVWDYDVPPFQDEKVRTWGRLDMHVSA